MNTSNTGPTGTHDTSDATQSRGDTRLTPQSTPTPYPTPEQSPTPHQTPSTPASTPVPHSGGTTHSGTEPASATYHDPTDPTGYPSPTGTTDPTGTYGSTDASGTHRTARTRGPAARAAAAELPLWRLRPINPLDPPFYLAGVPGTVIIAAATPEDARRVAAAAAGPHDAEAWLDGAATICDPLTAEEPGIIARDFDAVPALPPATAPPENVDVPYVQGIGAVGETLTCTMGNWDGVPRSYAYAWASDGAPNAKTGATYLIVAGDEGHSISCIVTATNELGSVAAPESNAVAVAGAARGARGAAYRGGEPDVAYRAGQPDAAGVPISAHADAARPGSDVPAAAAARGAYPAAPDAASADAARIASDEAYRAGQPDAAGVPGAPDAAYRGEYPATAAAPGAPDGVFARAATPGAPAAAAGAPGASAAGAPVSVHAQPPTVTGNGRVGEALTCSKGSWENEPASYAYAWQSDGRPNSAPGGETYTVVAGDVGHAISCIVTATNAAGEAAAPPSNTVAVSA